MRGRTGKLNAAKVANLKTPGHYGDGNNLYLQVSAAGTKSWCFRYRLGQRRRDMGLGAFPTVSLQEARDAALANQKLLQSKKDPIEEKRAEAAHLRIESARSLTFRECTQRYLQANDVKWSNEKHRKQWPSTLERYAFPKLGSQPVQLISKALILEVLEPIWATKAETAGRLRGRIEMVLGWATVSGFRDGPNPARWKDNLSHALPAKQKARRVKHHPALPYKEIATFLEKLKEQDGVSAAALQFTILTAARTNEVLGACWAEIDLDKKLWAVPAERMKARKPHRVPLSPHAVQLLERMHQTRQGEIIFPGQKVGAPLSNMAMLKTLARMERTGITVHGFRSTFRDWAAEHGHPSDVVEPALAHDKKSETERAYYRSDQFDRRIALMDAWGRYCSTPQLANPSNNVRQLFNAVA